MPRGTLGSCLSDPFLQLCCNHRSNVARKRSTSHCTSRPQSHSPRCPKRSGTAVRKLYCHQQPHLLHHLHHLLLLQHRHRRRLLVRPSPWLPFTQLAATQTLAVAFPTALCALPSSRSFVAFLSSGPLEAQGRVAWRSLLLLLRDYETQVNSYQ